MQQVKVKDIRVKTGTVKSGKNEGNPWELVIVIGEDGSEFTTFDTAVKDVGIGGTLELEAVIKNNKTNITFFKILEKGSDVPEPGAPAPPGTPTNGMTPEAWEKKDRLERWSREANACYMGLPALIAGKPPGDIVSKDALLPTEAKALEVWTAAMNWAKAHFTTTAPIAKTEKAEATLDKDWEKMASGSETPEFKNTGDFLTRATKEFNMTALGICIGLGVKEIAEVTDFTKAWATLVAAKANAES